MKVSTVHSHRLLLTTLVAAFVLSSCRDTKPGGGGVGKIPAPLVTQGNWEGPYSTSLTSVPSAQFHLTQAGSTVNGTFTAGTAVGTVSGYVFGEKLTFSITQTAPCAGTFSGTADAPGTDRLAFTFSGSDCLGSHADGLADLHKS